jgi:hypothetical protein
MPLHAVERDISEGSLAAAADFDSGLEAIAKSGKGASAKRR